MSKELYPDIYGTEPTFDERFPETPRKMSRWTAFSPRTLGLDHQCDDALCASPGAHRPTAEWSPIKPFRPTAEDLKFPDSPVWPYNWAPLRSEGAGHQDDLSASLFGPSPSWSSLGRSGSASTSFVPPPPLDVEVGDVYSTMDTEDGTTGREAGPELASTPAANTQVDMIHPQPSAQDGSSTGGNIGECSRHLYSSILTVTTEWLPFPQDRDQLVDYLAQGLSLRHLFPVEGTELEKNLVCKGELELTGDQWTHMGPCNQLHGSLETLQRHIKRRHLQAHGVSFSLEAILASWGVQDIGIGVVNRGLRVMPWDSAVQPFPPSLPPSAPPPPKRRQRGRRKGDLKTASRADKGKGKRKA